MVYELLQPLFSKGSKFKSDFITDFQREDENRQNAIKILWGFAKTFQIFNGIFSRNTKLNLQKIAN